MRRALAVLAVLVSAVVVAAAVVLIAVDSTAAAPAGTRAVKLPAATGTPRLVITPVVGGLDHPWDIAFAADGTMFFTERRGVLSVRTPGGTVRQLAADFSDLWVSGETGLMGVEADPDFATNRRLYTCQGNIDPSDNGSVNVIAWTVNAGLTAVTRVNDPLVGAIDGVSGRHGGCQLRVDASGFLRIGTGDAASGTNPQNVNSLAGKTLRVNRFTGAGVAGNPFIGGGGDPRIYTYGHRNVQGVALQPGTNRVFSVEHGPDRDDEVNLLVAGGNYGWNPVPGYNEAVPMTDLLEFPSAVSAVWSSGSPTVATSGATFLQGAQWRGWEGALAIAELKGSALRLLFVDANGGVVADVVPPELDGAFGRMRGAELGPDRALYLTTDNGSFNDRILRVSAESGDPFGAVDVVGRAPGGVRVAGWAIDPDTTNPTRVHVYVDSTGFDIGLASISRPDVGAAFGLGNNHGYDTVVPASAGRHTVCAYAINTAGPGVNQGIACRIVDVDPNPFGNFEVAVRAPGGLTVFGWAIDPDTANPIRVHVYVGSVGVDIGPAAGTRPDVGAAYPGYGSSHGFASHVNAPPGTHLVCAYAINGAGGGVNRSIGCKQVTIDPNPFGNFEEVFPTANGVMVKGWAIDPDTANPIRVHVYVDASGFDIGPASGNRPDVGAAYPGYTASHGFLQPVPVPPGTHRVCAYAINTVGGGLNQGIGCHTVTR